MGMLREVIFGNWRNKGVALFFAVTIWFVAYQSEKQEHGVIVRIDIKPAEPDSTIITGIRRVDPQTGAAVEFDGRVRFLFSGPRKQIDKLREDPPVSFPIQAARDRAVHIFSQGDFGYPRDGVEILEFTPESVQVSQEPAVTVTVKNMAERLNIRNFREGYEIASREVRDAVQVTGPASIMDRIGVAGTVSMDYDLERFEGKVDVQITHPEDVPADLVRRTVTVSPRQVVAVIALRASTDSLSVDGIRVTFRLPPVRVPVRIVLDDVVGDRIPVEIYGRKDDVQRLRERLRADPGFSLGVRVPPFDEDQGGQFTFTEDSLELYGYPGIQIRQHESRRKERKVGWSYSIVPVKEGET
jgi:hypothetical protein